MWWERALGDAPTHLSSQVVSCPVLPIWVGEPQVLRSGGFTDDSDSFPKSDIMGRRAATCVWSK